MVGAKYKIGADDAPTVSEQVHRWNQGGIRGALAILADRQELGQLKYHASSSSVQDGDETIHREMIEVVYRTENR
jgi:hypothetical protein